MATAEMETAVAPIATPTVTYPVTKADLESLASRAVGLTCDTPAGYEATRKLIADCRSKRVLVEKTRVELKKVALEYGRTVDSLAKSVTADIEAIENPLAEQKRLVDDAKERERQAKLEAIRLEQEARARAEREAEEARIRAEREKEEARLAEIRKEQERIAAEQKAEADRLATERAKIEAAQREAQAKIDAERAAIEAEKAEQARLKRIEEERIAREKFEAEAKAKAEQEAREKLAREQAESEQRKQAEAAEQARLEAMRPDVDKIRNLSGAIEALIDGLPTIKSKAASEFVRQVHSDLQAIASRCKAFKAK